MKKILSLMMIATLFLASCGDSQMSINEQKEMKYSEIYGTTQAVDTALDDYAKGDVKKASVVSDDINTKKGIGLVFEGMSDQETMTKVLDLLDKYKIKTTFFLPGIKAAEDSDTAKLVADRGQNIGSFTLEAKKKMQELTTEQLITDFTKTKCILASVTGKTPTLLRCNATEYTDNVRIAAKASGYESVVKPTIYFSYQSFKTYDQALDFISNTKKGSLITIKLDSVLDESEFEKEVEDERPADDKQAGIKDEDKTDEEDVSLVDVIEMVLRALNNSGKKTEEISPLLANDDTDYDSIKSANQGRKAQTFIQAKTTKNSVGLSIRNISSEKVLNRTLQTLKSHGAKATFFVTAENINKHPDWIKLILNNGHELGNAGTTGQSMTNMSFNEICSEINQCKKLLKSKFSYQASFFMTPDAKTNDKILEAASAMGYRVGGYNKQPIRDVKQSVNAAYTYFKNGFMRGDIVSVRLDNYAAIDQVVSIVASKAASSGFSVTGLSAIYSGQYGIKPLKSVSGWNTVKINSNYNSVKDVESRVIDRIDTNKKVVFITFDDWGSDVTINRLLKILRENHIKATFFIRANGPELNPNLLKTIDQEGHQIANHTYEHKVLTTLSSSSVQKQVVKAHQILTQILGKTPTLYFRPPTYSTNTRLNKVVLSTGIKYILMSDVSTHDYEKSAKTVVNYVMKNVQPGSIITLHMSDNSCAHKALPTMIKKLKSKGYSIGYLGDYL